MSKPEEINSSINAGNLFINKVFSDDFEFSIPNYQRPYSWEEEHCLQLIDDIETFAFKSTVLEDLSPYFLGSIVVIKKPGVTEAQIVDGQQRLTTITILLSCLRYLIDNEDDKNDITDLIFQKGSSLKGTNDTFRLKTRKKDHDFFKNLIQEKDGIKNYFNDPSKYVAQNDSQEKMLVNMVAMISALEKTKGFNQDNLKQIASYIIQKCTLVVVRSTDEEIAFRIFNVLNDRGLDLSIADILKSEVIEKIPAKEEESYTQKWEDAEEYLGIDSFKNFFSHLRSIYAKKKAEKAVLTEIREYINPGDKPKEFIDDILKPLTDAYHDILKEKFESEENAESVNHCFSKLKRVPHNDWYPAAILFLARNRGAHQEILKFFEFFESLTIGLEGMGATLNERIDRYALIVKAIEQKNDLYSKDSPLLLSVEDKNRIEDKLNSTNLYGKRLVKPVLARIEEELNDGSIKLNYGGLSIEHILPKTVSDKYWQSLFSIEDQINLKNCLGNLSLISVRKNSQASNFPFKKKVETYFKRDDKSSNLAMVMQLKTEEDWTTTRIENRKNYMIEKFLKSIDNPRVKWKV